LIVLSKSDTGLAGVIKVVGLDQVGQVCGFAIIVFLASVYLRVDGTGLGEWPRLSTKSGGTHISHFPRSDPMTAATGDEMGALNRATLRKEN